MSGNIKGITVEINGNVNPLDKALKQVNSTTKSLQSELKGVESLLKMDPGNIDLLKQKQELLNTSIGTTQDKLSALKTAKTQADSDMSNGTQVNQTEYRNLTREIASTEQKLKSLTEESKTFGSVAAQQVAAVGSKMESVGGKMTGVGKQMSVLSAGIVAAGAAAVKAGSDVAESENKVSVSFGSAADKINAFSEKALENFGMAKGTALDMASLFGDMGTSMGLSQDAAADMSTSLVGLAGDLASFKNVGLDVAQNALKGIFTGETESLKSLGVVMTQTNLESYAMANGINKSYSEMSEAEKIQLRYNYVLNATKNAQGDFANTSDGTANSIRTLQETLKELAAGFGEILMPIITPFIQKITSMVKWLGSLDDSTKKVIVTVAGIVAAIGPTLVVVGTLIEKTGIILQHLPQMKAALMGVKGAFAALTGPVGIAIAVIAALVAAFALAYNKSETFRDAVNSLIDNVKNTLVPVFNTLKDIFITNVIPAFEGLWNQIQTGILPALEELWAVILNNIIPVFKEIVTGIQEAYEQAKPLIEALKPLFEMIFNDIKIVISTAWEVINTIISTALDVIKGIINLATAVIKGDWSAAWDAIKGIVSTVFGGIKDIISDIWVGIKIIFNEKIDLLKSSVSKGFENIKTGITNKLNEVATKVKNIGKNVVEGLWNGISNAKNWLLDKIEDWCGSILDGIKAFFGIHSPSTVMRDEVGSNIVKGIVEGIEDEKGTALDAITSVSKDLVDAAIDSLGEIPVDFVIGNMDNVVSSLNEGAQYATSDITANSGTESTEDLAEKLATIFSTALLEGLNYVGNSILEALPKGVTMNLNGTKFATASWDNFVDVASRKNRVFSPSRSEIYEIALAAAKSVLNS